MEIEFLQTQNHGGFDGSDPIDYGKTVSNELVKVIRGSEETFGDDVIRTGRNRYPTDFGELRNSLYRDRVPFRSEPNVEVDMDRKAKLGTINVWRDHQHALVNQGIETTLNGRTRYPQILTNIDD